MDKRSFFRGFGIGVIFSSLILGISFVVRTSDSFTKQRALELGMIYESTGDAKTVLSENAGGTESAEKLAASVGEKEDSDEETGEEDKKSKKTKKSSSDTKKSSETSSGESSEASSGEKSKDSVDMEKEKERMEKEVSAEAQKLTINAGEWSTTVSKKLQSMGIIEDAVDFDKYLDKNGFSSSISAGTYDVSKNDTYLDLAKKITKR